MALLAEAIITGDDQYTTPVEILGQFNITILSDGYVGFVQLERSFDGGANWGIVLQLQDQDIEASDSEPEKCLYRLGVPLAGYTSGTIYARLGGEDATFGR